MTETLLSKFRKAVYQSFQCRADGLMDLIDALTVAGHVDSPVALSEEIPYRRQFSMIYDTLRNGEFEFDRLLHTLNTYQTCGSETIAGYRIYAIDTTPNERPEAVTLPDRGALKASKHEPVRYGHKYSWLTRLVQPNTSWVAPVDIERVSTDMTDSQLAAVQVKALDQRDQDPKVVVADSRYSDHTFLAIFSQLAHCQALVRTRGNRVLYEQPRPKAPGAKGAPRKHGTKFKLQQPTRETDATESFLLSSQTVRVQAWHNLHFKKLANVEGSVLKIEFLKTDGTPRYQRPIWLFWTGPATVGLEDLCRMYLWRFSIEHFFRFLKQHMGLNSNRSPNLVSTAYWMWLCALAYWQLLLLRQEGHHHRPAWHPRFKGDQPRTITPRQVQRSALPFLLQLGTPAVPTKPAGKGCGRSKGYHPMPRIRYQIVRKSRKPANSFSRSP
jgi:hypothetical protein